MPPDITQLSDAELLQQAQLAQMSDADLMSLAASSQPKTPETYGSRLANNLVAAADAASFGLADEGAAAVRSVLPGYGSYDQELAAIRGGMKEYQGNHPYQALASSILGGAAPVIAAEVASGGAATPEVVPGLLNTIKSGAKTGAAYGGAYGYGSGEDGVTNRLVHALVGAGTGAAGGAALGGAAYGAGKGLQSMSGYQAALDPVAESGAIFPGGASQPSLTAEQAYLSRRLRNVPTDELAQGQQAMEQAVSEDSPMFLPESLQSPGLTRLTRFLAGHEPSMDTVQNAVAGRKAGALDRVSGILDEVSPERSPVNAGETVQGIIGDIKDQIIKVRKEDAAPHYDALRASGDFESDAVKTAVSSDRVKSAIKSVRKDFPEFEGKSDLDFGVLDSAKQWLYGEAQRTNNPTEKRFIDNIRAKLVNAMDAEKPDYAKARAVFEDDSTPLSQLFGDKGKPMVDLSRRKAENVGTALLGLDKQRISDIADEFGTERAKALTDAARAALQGKIESKKDNQNLVSDIVEVPAMREKLRTLIGDDQKFDRLMRLLGRENKYARAANNYNPGSTTAGNLEESGLLKEGVKKITAALSAIKHPEKIVDYLVDRKPNDEVARKLAEVLTDPQRGLDFYNQVLPKLQQQRANSTAVQAVAQPLGQVGGVASAVDIPRRR